MQKKKPKKENWQDTKDGSAFISAFEMRDTYGLPLTVLAQLLIEKQILFSVPHFIIDAINAGWSKDKIRAELRQFWVEHLPKKEVEELISMSENFLKYERKNN